MGIFPMKLFSSDGECWTPNRNKLRSRDREFVMYFFSFFFLLPVFLRIKMNFNGRSSTVSKDRQRCRIIHFQNHFQRCQILSHDHQNVFSCACQDKVSERDPGEAKGESSNCLSVPRFVRPSSCHSHSSPFAWKFQHFQAHAENEAKPKTIQKCEDRLRIRPG